MFRYFSYVGFQYLFAIFENMFPIHGFCIDKIGFINAGDLILGNESHCVAILVSHDVCFYDQFRCILGKTFDEDIKEMLGEVMEAIKEEDDA